MVKHSISEAARITGKSRSTIHRHIKSGKVSKEISEGGSPVVDTSELQRVYGSLSHRHTHETVPLEQHYTSIKEPSEAIEVASLKRENEMLREDRDRWIAQAERLTHLLTHQEPRRGSWISRLFRGK